MSRKLKPLMVALLLCGGLLFTSCSSSPSDEELAQLRQLQDQASSLKQQLETKQRDKASLEKQIAEKNGKLQQCQSDQEAVKKAMGGK